MFSLPIPILLVITVIASWLNSLICGFFPKRVSSDDGAIDAFNLLRNLFCAAGVALLLSLSGALGSVSLFTVVLGVLMGLANIFGVLAHLKAFAIGPFSYTTVIVSLSAIIPALSGLFFGESVSAVQWVGVALMVLCLFLSPEKAEGEQKKVNAKWMILSLVSAALSGVTGIIQKVHQNSEHADEMGALLISTFAVSAVISAFMLLFGKNKRNVGAFDSAMRRPLFWILPIVGGCVFAFPHTINLFLSGQLKSVIFFPIVNLCPMLVSMLSGMLIFRERLSLRRWAGVAVGILSTVLLAGII